MQYLIYIMDIYVMNIFILSIKHIHLHKLNLRSLDSYSRGNFYSINQLINLFIYLLSRGSWACLDGPHGSAYITISHLHSLFWTSFHVLSPLPFPVILEACSIAVFRKWYKIWCLERPRLSVQLPSTTLVRHNGAIILLHPVFNKWPNCRAMEQLWSPYLY